MTDTDAPLTIGAVVKATGVGEATLRAWERRFGFPDPEREPSGHRRYSETTVNQVKSVLRHRAEGLQLGLAIERAIAQAPRETTSVFAQLRRSRPELASQAIRSREMTRLSRAVEEEIAARAEGGLLVGAFQSEAAYRRSELRWRDLSRGGMESFVLADFARLRTVAGGPTEVPVGETGPMVSEWILVCVAEGHGVCLIGRERPGQRWSASERIFDGFLSLEPDIIREAAEAAIRIAEPHAPAVAEAARERLESVGDADPLTQLRLSGQITSRFVAAVG